MTQEEIQYEAQSIIQECGSNDSAPYVEFVEKLASMELQETPSNLDEAAMIMADECLQGLPINGEVIPALKDIIKIAVRYGAEWMAGQGVTLNLSIDEFSYGAYNACVEQGLTSEDEVIVQIRKK